MINKWKKMLMILLFGSMTVSALSYNQDANSQNNPFAQSPLDKITAVNFVPTPTSPPDPYSIGNFVDNQHAWVDLKRTTDGGHSWQEMKLSLSKDVKNLLDSRSKK